VDDRPARVGAALLRFWRRWAGSNTHDVIRMLVLAAVLVLGSYGEAHPNNKSDQVLNGQPVPHTPDAALLLVVAATVVLAVRRWYPVPVLIFSTAGIVAYSLLGYVNGAVLVAAPFALYSVVTRVSLLRALGFAAGTTAVLMAATAAGNPFGPTGGGFYLIPAMIVVALFIGTAVANQRARVAAARDKVEEESKRRVDEERLRIARELHDIVAHTMATINVQAGAAAHVLADNPQAAGDALQAIRQSSKDGLRELRAILNVLRQADEGDPTQPTPGLGQLDALISNSCGAGLPVTLYRSGQTADLPPAVDLAAYRIVQESLTNVIKHAGPAAAATVSLRYASSGLEIEVTDTGLGPGPAAMTAGEVLAGNGHGLIGMRERAASVGGSLQTGPGPGGGYRVFATLPAGAVPDPPDAASAASASSAQAS
jgi:signal transduction histidine kinase